MERHGLPDNMESIDERASVSELASVARRSDSSESRRQKASIISSYNLPILMKEERETD